MSFSRHRDADNQDRVFVYVCKYVCARAGVNGSQMMKFFDQQLPAAKLLLHMLRTPKVQIVQKYLHVLQNI